LRGNNLHIAFLLYLENFLIYTSRLTLPRRENLTGFHFYWAVTKSFNAPGKVLAALASVSPWTRLWIDQDLDQRKHVEYGLSRCHNVTWCTVTS
jgi:hypothetical protein